MKKNVQHDFILTEILKEIRELRKDVEYIKSHYEVSIPEDYVINTSPIDFTQSDDWYKELISLTKDVDCNEEIIKLTEETQKIIDDYEKKHGASCDANNLYLNYISKFKKYFLGE